jgi:hypothetical protein
VRAHSAAASQIIFTEPRQNVLTFGVDFSISATCSLADSGLLAFDESVSSVSFAQRSRSSQPPSSSLFDLAMMFSLL